MKLLGVFLLVVAVLSFFKALGMRPPQDMAGDVGAAFMIGTMILPAMFAVTGVWCLFKKRRDTALKTTA